MTFLASAPTVFISVPIWLGVLSNLAMGITNLVISIQTIIVYWPGFDTCSQYQWDPVDGRYRTLPGSPECLKARDTVRILMGVSIGLELLIGFVLSLH